MEAGLFAQGWWLAIGVRTLGGQGINLPAAGDPERVAEGTKKVNLIFLQLRPEMPVINGEKHCYKWGYHSLNEIVTDL